MKPVMQSKLYAEDAPMRGNCRAAAFASILEIPLWMVPAIEDMRGDLQNERWEEWLDRLFGLALIRTEGHDVGLMPDFYVACGPSPRGDGTIYHSVVYSRGELVHDPHPSGRGILSVEWTWHLVPARQAEN